MPTKKERKPATTTTQLELVYDGPDVKNGTIGLEDMVSALIGFGRAYAKVAELHRVEVPHQLRVTGIRRASADIQIAVQFATPEMLSAMGTVLTAAGGILASIALIIKVTRHAGKPSRAKEPNISVKGDGNVVVVNGAGAKMEIPKREYDIWHSGLLESDLHNLTRPLEAGRIDYVEFRQDRKPIEGTRIDADERDLFEHSTQGVTTTKDDVWLEGELRSLNKKTNVGMFYLTDGRGVRYRFASSKPQHLYRGFAHVGPVRVRCRAHFDESLNPVFVEVFDVKLMQPPLPGTQ